MPYFFFMKHPMCLSVRREGRGRREKGPELACAATSSLQAEPLPSWGNARTAPRSSAWPFPTVQPGCSHGSCWVQQPQITWAVSQSDISEGWIWGGGLGGQAGASCYRWTRHCGCSCHNSSQGWVTRGTAKAVTIPEEAALWEKPRVKPRARQHGPAHTPAPRDAGPGRRLISKREVMFKTSRLKSISIRHSLNIAALFRFCLLDVNCC